ncbi:MAG: DMT family transporter [Bacteroidales bacterium]|nr:DMT family transporter [Bacteroidales bacterium]MDD4823074.1 DMT family transporter [Bacteroidales bacterium]
MWLLLAFGSAFFLGWYDISKKISLKDNAVIPVLFLNVLTCCLIFLPAFVLSLLRPELLTGTMFYVPQIPFAEHGYLMLKACIVLSSWLFAYFAMKHLPITITSPVKASQPILTLVGAMLIFSERLNLYQWIGIILSFISFYILSLAGKKEGISFKRNIWVLFIFMAIITGAISGLYDKYLMARFDKMTVQVWYNYYQLILMTMILLFLWFPVRKKTTSFHWSWAIPLIAVCLTVSDFLYFWALSYEDSMIAIVSMIRRGSVIVSFIGGVFLFREKNLKSKALDLLLVLLGMLFIYLGSK